MSELTRRQLMFAGSTGLAGAWLLTGCSASPTPGGSTSLASAITVDALTVPAGGSYELTATTRTRSLTIGAGGTITVPTGRSLTLTVDGVETGQVLATATGTTPSLVAGTYTGDVVLTVADAHPVTFDQLTFPFRQAVYVDASGVVAAKSVAAAVITGSVTGRATRGLELISTGAVFNGVVVAGGSYTLNGATITMTGNGRSDFAGYGAAVMGTGSSTRLVVDKARITTEGVVRTAVVAGDGANVVVKNSTIKVSDGTLPADFVPNVSTAYMQTAPWMLGLSGNARATNVVGSGTVATYVASTVTSDGWGALSTDDDDQIKLTAVNTDVAVSGSDGYGSYCNGTAALRFLGTRFTVPSYGVIATGGSMSFEDSTATEVAALDSSLELGLSASERAALTPRATTIDSGRFGLMWHGAGSATITGGTRITSKEAVFLDKGQQVAITVDGSGGARLHAANGTILQVMTNDDPGTVTVDGVALTTGVYTEPTGLPQKAPRFDPTTASSSDAVATFTKIDLVGDFYNAFRGGPQAESSGAVAGQPAGTPPTGALPTGAPTGALSTGTPPAGATPSGARDGVAPVGDGGAAQSEGKNLVLTFDASSVRGVLTASTAAHRVKQITSADYTEIGRITNTVHPVINNGVLVTLQNGSTWAVTGTSYLSMLTLDASSKVVAAYGSLTVTVSGKRTTITPGRTYTGAIVVRNRPAPRRKKARARR